MVVKDKSLLRLRFRQHPPNSLWQRHQGGYIAASAKRLLPRRSQDIAGTTRSDSAAGHIASIARRAFPNRSGIIQATHNLLISYPW
jgi:hypothetical protein